ncbi:hypothetical protein RB653_003676 [Dictyostelium firmibasis]|uniref:Transmembrane protein n=1 Tax=Dictyostelium firmibasis TaxID=79012 RepID=A0AAN7UHW1_9MYCE
MKTNIKIIILLLTVIFLNFINCDLKVYYSPTTGDWSDNNWYDGQTLKKTTNPTTKDDAFLTYVDQQSITNTKAKAIANNIVVGSFNLSTVFTTNYGIQTNIFKAEDQTTPQLVIFNISGDPLVNPDYRIDIGTLYCGFNCTLRTLGGHFYAPNTSVSIYGAVGWVIQDTIASGFYLDYTYSALLMSNATMIVENAFVDLFSSWNVLDQSKIVINNTLNKFVVQDGSILDFENSNISIYNSMLLTGSQTQLQFHLCNVDFGLVELVPISKWVDNKILFTNSSFECYHQVYVNGSSGSSLIYFNQNSNAIFNDEVEFNGDSMLGLNGSKMTTAKSLLFDDNSGALITNSEINVMSQFATLGNSMIYFENSKFLISIPDIPSNMNRLFFVRGNSLLQFKMGSVGVLDAHLLTSDDSALEIYDSSMTIAQESVFYNNSRVSMSNSTIFIQQVLNMMDSSLFEVVDSVVKVTNYTSFSGKSSFVVANSEIYVQGQYYDFTNNLNGSNIFNNSLLSVTGSFINTGNLFVFYSNVSVGGEFKNYGSLVTSTSDYVIDGTFTNKVGANFLIELGSMKIVEGEMILENNSNMTTYNTSITIMKGSLVLESGSSLSLLNTQLFNSLGKVATLGDIIVNEGGSLRNDAHFVLQSNVLPVNNTGSESFINAGTIEIDGGEKGIKVLLPFINNGGNVIISKETSIKTYNQDGGSLVLDGALVHSNETINLSNSSLYGIGTINSSLSVSSGIVGDKKTVGILNVNGEFNSNNGEFIFTLDSVTNSTLINIGKNATINNSTLIIRINKNFIDSLLNSSSSLPSNSSVFNQTILNYESLSGSGFGEIKFGTYEPATGEEKSLPSCYSASSSNSGKNFGLLIRNDGCSGGDLGDENNGNGKKSSLSTGAIVGIVVGIAGLAAIVGGVIYFRNRLPTSQTLKYKIKQISKSQESQAN